MALHLIQNLAVEPCRLSDWSGDPTRCHWCNTAVGSHSNWCSFVCEDAHRVQHEWSSASAEALIRDGERCDLCGTGPADFDAARLFIRAFIPMGPVASATLWRSQEWMALQLAFSVDVVQRRPNPSGYRSGCHNHLTELVTLCHRCQDRARHEVDLRTG